ncbi:MAG: sulfotransferase [Aureliella sp.]
MRIAVWWRLLLTNRLRISPSRLHIAIGVSFFSLFNDVGAAIQWAIFGGKIRRAKVETPPVFILGHWRSGTTLLHELLSMDEQFASPSTYQCFAPSHHLVSEWMFTRFGRFLLPEKRPMDNMKAGWELPQEDEFALMNLGAPTPYLRIAFPHTQDRAMEYFNLERVSADDRAKWASTLDWFMRTLLVRYPGKRLVMKSPPHTGRVAELARAYPGAKFIHLVRDPRKMFLSTIRLWRSLDAIQALQTDVSDDDMRQYVTDCFKEMYQNFQHDAQALPAGSMVELRYEDLVADPSGAIEKLYSQLELGDFEAMKPALMQRLENHATYKPNQHNLDAEVEAIIQREWADYIQQYGYA